MISSKSLSVLRKVATVRLFSTTQVVRKAEDRKERLASLPQKDQGTFGETSADIDALLKTANLSSDQLRDSVFHSLPIVNIRTSPNNTIINVTDSNGVPRLIRSCGIEGFKNARKGTNIAAQATAVNIVSFLYKDRSLIYKKLPFRRLKPLILDGKL